MARNKSLLIKIIPVVVVIVVAVITVILHGKKINIEEEQPI
jgi:hypothetical protein